MKIGDEEDIGEMSERFISSITEGIKEVCEESK